MVMERKTQMANKKLQLEKDSPVKKHKAKIVHEAKAAEAKKPELKRDCEQVGFPRPTN